MTLNIWEYLALAFSYLNKTSTNLPPRDECFQELSIHVKEDINFNFITDDCQL